MLSLRLELLTGRYVATEFNDRNHAEWPPHPARVFSALVAAHHEGNTTPGQREALRWLETLPAPSLTFSKASYRDITTHYVPVNDKALSDAKTVDNAWAKLLAPGLTDKQLAKAEARLSTAYEKESAPYAKLPDNLRKLWHVLPASRTKQPRTFPSVTPEDPFVWLTWDAEPTPDVREGLDGLARQLVRVGHSSSLVAARFMNEGPAPTWIPDHEGSQPLRWIGPGQLDALEVLHAAAHAEQRVMPYVVARYHPPATRDEPNETDFSTKFIVLRRVNGPRLPLLASEPLAQAVRAALMSHASSPTPALLCGHEPGGGPLQADHLAIVPLPHVGSRHASGDLLGVALVPPANLDLDDLRPLHAAIARWESQGPKGGNGPRSTLTLGRLGRWTLERSLDPPSLYNLQEITWTRKSKQWASVTPIIFDRHPGSLHEGRSSRRRRAIARAHATIAAACERIGLPRPEEIELDLAPFFRGSEPAREFIRRKGAVDKRPLTHVRLTFAKPVRGPVLLGAGRYRGLGLLRPVGETSS